ncbi:MAG: ACP S-malonyltransferase [Proteobacteria bacterium]|nr:ACP S-malonyltransferase [Pseudomonadota bacterium]
MSKAFVFPGQGSQAVGMGRELAGAFQTARHLFQEMDDSLNQKLSTLMFEGPEEELTLTENAQPALMAVSVAVARVLEIDGGQKLADTAAYAAGHSLGEYSALTAAGTFEFATAARLLKARGKAMQQAVPVGEGAMAALIGIEMDALEKVLSALGKGDICAVANDNAPGQIVISGATAVVNRVGELAKEKGAKRAISLPVSAPFHCPMMAPAAEVMARELESANMVAPSFAIVPNVTAAAETDPDALRRLLVEQVTARVRWRESIGYMRDNGVDTIVELGAGNVLTGMTRRIDRELSGTALQSPEDIEAYLKAD